MLPLALVVATPLAVRPLRMQASPLNQLDLFPQKPTMASLACQVGFDIHLPVMLTHPITHPFTIQHTYFLSYILFLKHTLPASYNANAKHSYDILRASTPADIDPANKERHLSVTDFLKVFGTDIKTFNALPKWKRDAKKKDAGLF